MITFNFRRVTTPLAQLRLPALCLLACCLMTPWSSAQDKPSTANKPKFKPVHAPNAQRLVEDVVAKHPEAQLVGLHLVPPDRPENVIVASNVMIKIGKPSNAADLAVMDTMKSVIHRNEQDGVYDVQMPLLDAHGKLIGMMVELVRISSTADQDAALKAAENLRKDVEAKIPTSEWLFEDGK